jgi:hypothetical protein
MASNEPASLSDGFSKFYEQISEAADELNAASDALGKPIPALNAFLKTLNLGISTWVQFEGDENYQNGTYWQNSIGYAKAAGKWGICISKENGNLQDPDGADYESWPFNEAPRALRIRGIDKLPELLEKILAETRNTTAKVKAKAERTQELADTIKTLTGRRK